MAEHAKARTMELHEVPGVGGPAVQLILDHRETDESERDLWRAFAEHMRARRLGAPALPLPATAPLRLL